MTPPGGFLSGTVLILYVCTLLLVCFYGLHRYVLVYLYYRNRACEPRLAACFTELPRVTVQLPMFNERLVAARVIQQTCAIDYPSDRLQIQVLDDSTDDTADIVLSAAAALRRQGHDIEVLHRTDRTGFKAGALREALDSATGEFICIFDADFMPTSTVLKEAIHHFTDPRIGMVQARWDHVNRNQSLLTRVQAVLLDGHFILEHGSRNRSGRFMSFNGTAGIWRRACIEDAGGWQHDTLTEDLDLSYRAQLRGWKFVFLPGTTVPAEVPPEIAAFKAQQYRWAKGGAQTCRKLLPTVLGSRFSWAVKLEAFWHLTGHVVYPSVVLLSLLLFPALYLKLHVFAGHPIGRTIFDLVLLALATCSAGTFYCCSQRELNKGWWASIKYLPAIMSLGIGMAINNARAVLDGWFGRTSVFVRTPKFGTVDDEPRLCGSREPAYSTPRGFSLQPWLELAMGAYMTACITASVATGRVGFGIPFLLLFATGYFYVSISTLLGENRGRTPAPAAPPALARPEEQLTSPG